MTPTVVTAGTSAVVVVAVRAEVVLVTTYGIIVPNIFQIMPLAVVSFVVVVVVVVVVVIVVVVVVTDFTNASAPIPIPIAINTVMLVVLTFPGVLVVLAT